MGCEHVRKTSTSEALEKESTLLELMNFCPCLVCSYLIPEESAEDFVWSEIYTEPKENVEILDVLGHFSIYLLRYNEGTVVLNIMRCCW